MEDLTGSLGCSPFQVRDGPAAHPPLDMRSHVPASRALHYAHADGRHHRTDPATYHARTQAKKLLMALAKLQGQPAPDLQLQPAASAPAAVGYPSPATAAHPSAAVAEPPPSPLGGSGPQQRSLPMGVAAPTASQSMQLQPSAGSNVEGLRQQLEAEVSPPCCLLLAAAPCRVGH